MTIEFDYFYTMDYRDIISLFEVLLLAGVFFFLFRFIFTNYSSKVRKPASWVMAVKKGEINADLLKAEKKYPDRIRFYNFWLQINRIVEEKIPGDFAELGVYKGETAKIIHLCAPERNLHLFDTFEGFPAEDLKDETGKASAYTTNHFADTSLEKVRTLLEEQENIFYHKGYFPDSIGDSEDKIFAFASIDADLYQPTKAGLEYFYPRLSPGGIILVHDYNSDWPELMRAVDEFVGDIPESYIPVPDADSTVMIIKAKKSDKKTTE